ncbi:MAG: Beta-glucosidase BoGH3B [Flavobacteriales bacterium]|nr:MAG: Beta-glucosidase BoGH3B [Flavobacteriales bacterium]
MKKILIILFAVIQFSCTKGWVKLQYEDIITVENFSWFEDGPDLKFNNSSGVDIIINNSFAFKDLNKNGELDDYENWTLPIDKRVDDLISKMTVEEKAGSMFIHIAFVGENGEMVESPIESNPFSAAIPSMPLMLNKLKMNHFNIFNVVTKENMLKWSNMVQQIGEKSRLGIPITIASDPRHGVPNTIGPYAYTPFFSSWPSPLGLAASRDNLLVQEHAKIVREEYRAIGITLALGPMADISTEPRWGRVNGTFGEDSELVSSLTKSYITGLQGDELDNKSVASMVKHFPGSGPLDGGKDSHFPPGIQSYRGDNFDYHIKPFEEAIKIGVSSIMPYYSLPIGITKEEVAAGYNSELLLDLLRNKYSFDGIICTDWAIISDISMPDGELVKPASAYGVENLDISERLKKVIMSGVDLIGGENLTMELVNLIQSGQIDESRIDMSISRIMKQKFQLGLFDNPYLEDDMLNIYDNKFNRDKGIEAQKKSLVLLKNLENILPLSDDSKIFYHGFDEDFISQNNLYDYNESQVNVIKVNSPNGRFESEYMFELLLGGGPLDFTLDEVQEYVKIIKEKPTIIIANLSRPTILTELESNAVAIIADFGSNDSIIKDLIYGKFNPSGKLPFDLPSSMESVNNQLEDLPFDLKDPLYSFGHGLSYE